MTTTEPMTADQFKAWFEGYAENIGYNPSGTQWERIKDQVARLSGFPSPYAVPGIPAQPTLPDFTPYCTSPDAYPGTAGTPPMMPVTFSGANGTAEALSDLQPTHADIWSQPQAEAKKAAP